MYDYNEGEAINAENESRGDNGQRELLGLLETHAGRKFIFRILEEGYIFSTTFTKSSQGYFNEGKRDTALRIFNDILDLDPNIFAKMCLEFRGKDG